MIIKTIHVPHLYAYTPAAPVGSVEANLYYGACTGLLSTMVGNCVVMVDKDFTLLSDMRMAIEKWPIKYRQRAIGIINRLEKQQRFVPVCAEHACNDDCRGNCMHAVALAQACQPDAFIAAPECSCDGQCADGRFHAMALSEYAIQLGRLQRERSCYILNAGDWSKEEFSRKIWKPVFSHTKRVHLIDPHIGRTVTESVWKSNHSQQIHLKPAYSKSLDWIFKSFSEYALNPEAFTVTTEVGPLNHPKKDIRDTDALEARFILEDFAEHCSSNVKFEFDIRVSDTPGLKMHHDRFLFTDQVKLQFGSGFDLLKSPDYKVIRDVTVMVADFDRAGFVYQAAKKLTPAEQYPFSSPFMRITTKP